MKEADLKITAVLLKAIDIAALEQGDVFYDHLASNLYTTLSMLKDRMEQGEVDTSQNVSAMFDIADDSDSNAQPNTNSTSSTPATSGASAANATNTASGDDDATPWDIDDDDEDDDGGDDDTDWDAVMNSILGNSNN